MPKPKDAGTSITIFLPDALLRELDDRRAGAVAALGGEVPPPSRSYYVRRIVERSLSPDGAKPPAAPTAAKGKRAA